MSLFKSRSRPAAEENSATAGGPTEDDKMVVHTYTIRVEADELDGGFVADVVERPGCMSQGGSVQQAVVNVTEALRAVLEVEGETHVRISEPDLQNNDVANANPRTTRVPIRVSAYA